MLRRCSIIVIFLFVLNSFTVIFAKEEIKDWHFSKEINTDSDSPYWSVFLDEEVYEHAREDLADLRVVDGDGEFVPYYLVSGFGELNSDEIVYTSELVYKMEKVSETTLDFLIHPRKLDVDVQGNALKVALPEVSFLKFVDVSGSYDGQEWEYLGEHKLYNTGEVQRDTVNLGSMHKFNYYRLNIQDNLEKIAFQDIHLVRNELVTSWNEFSKSTVPPYEVEQDGKRTKVTITNNQQLQISSISLVVDGNFRRSYHVEDKEGKSLPIRDERELYNLDFAEFKVSNMVVNFAMPVTSEEIVLFINNNDNPPLGIAGISLQYSIDQLVFADNGSESYLLIYGNGQAARPVYDIASFKEHILRERPVIAELGGAMELPSHEDKPTEVTDHFPTHLVFNISIILASLVLIVLIGSKLRGIRKT